MSRHARDTTASERGLDRRSPCPPSSTRTPSPLAARRLEDNRRFSARNTKEPSLLMGLVVLSELRLRLLPDLDAHQEPQVLLLPLPRLRRLPLRARAGLRQQAGARRLPRRARLGTGHRPAGRSQLWCKPNSTGAWPSCAPPTRRPPNGPGSNSTSPGPPRASSGSCTPTKRTCSPSTSCAPACPTCEPKRPACAASLASLDAQLLDRDTYLKLAENLEGFLARLRDTADTATIEARQKVLRSVVKEVLVGPERVVIRHSIPGADRPFRPAGYPLRLRSHLAAARQHVPPLRL